MTRFHFFILVLIVSISGFSQGMLLPVISVIFEQEGHSAALNGLHATGLYIGRPDRFAFHGSAASQARF